MGKIVPWLIQGSSDLISHAILYPIDVIHTSELCNLLDQNKVNFWYNQMFEAIGYHGLVTGWRRYRSEKFGIHSFWWGFWKSMGWQILKWTTGTAFFSIFAVPPFLSHIVLDTVAAPQMASLIYEIMDKKEPPIEIQSARFRFETLLNFLNSLTFGSVAWYFHTKLPESSRYVELLARDIHVKTYATYASQPFATLYHRAKISNRGIHSFNDLYKLILKIYQEEGPLAFFYGIGTRLVKISYHGSLNWLCYSYLSNLGIEKYFPVSHPIDHTFEEFDKTAWKDTSSRVALLAKDESSSNVQSEL